MNEADTRAEHIDPALKAAGWGVIEVKNPERLDLNAYEAYESVDLFAHLF